VSDDEKEGLGPRPPSPEGHPLPRSPSPPEPAASGAIRSPSAPDWWQPGMSIPPGAAPPPLPPIKFERGRPMAMREMRIGELIDTAVKLYRSSWRIFVGISAVVLVPFSFLQSFLTRSQIVGFLHPERIQDRFQQQPNFDTFWYTIAFALLNALLIAPFLTGVFARVASELYLGHEPDTAETLTFGLRKLGGLLVVTLLTFLAVLGGTVLLIVPGILFYVRFAFAPAALVVEDTGAIAAMRRSWRLVRGHFWRLFGTLLLASLLVGIVGGIAGAPFVIAAQFIGPAGWPLAAAGNAIAGIFTRPFVLIIVVLLYFDLRIRKEGFDLAVMVAEIAHGPLQT
jgi:hypothetical protein